MNTNKLSLKVASLLVLLSTACTSVIPNVDREERQSVGTRQGIKGNFAMLATVTLQLGCRTPANNVFFAISGA